METKICRICGEEKNIENFRKSGKWYRTECKNCERKYNKNWDLKNKEKRREYERKKRLKIKDTDEYKKYHKQYRDEHKEEAKQYKKEYYSKEENRNRKKETDKEYRIKNKDKINQRVHNRKQNDYIFKLKCQTRNILLNSFKRNGKIKSERTEKILGCDLEFFVEHLLQTFKNNYGYEWNKTEPVHIDHIIPLATAKTEEEVIKLCHYTNLQLLKAEDNLNKKDKLDWRI